jgi:hypothetical protein
VLFRPRRVEKLVAAEIVAHEERVRSGKIAPDDAIALACSAFTRVAACTLALSPIRDTLTRGFSHFVASITAPVASGWSGCRVGLAPTGKRLLSRRTPVGDIDGRLMLQ